MRVGFDLRYATDHFPGIGTHARHLLHALLASPGDDSFVVIWNPALRNSRFDLADVRRHPRVEWVECGIPPLGPVAPLALGALLRRLAPDVYLSPFVMMPFRAGCPAVLTLHDVLPLSRHGDLPWARRAVFALAVRAARGAARVVTSSEFSREELVRLGGLDPRRVCVIRPGVPTRERSGAVPDPDVSERPFALVVGVNKPHKNLRTLAAAWRGATPKLPLDLVGVGPLDPRYPSLAGLAGDASDVRALGRVSEAELDRLYLSATTVLFPSLYEGFGFPLLEAAARGAPVIASDIPALREIGQGVARFVPPEDAVAWASAIRELAGDREERARMVKAGFARVGESTYSACAASMRRMLAEVVAAPLSRDSGA